MKITVDTNVLVRAIVVDDPAQAKLAQAALGEAELVVVTTTSLCEFVWVLSRGYGFSRADVSAAIRGLMESANVEPSRPAVEAGLALLDEGGDFADGVIAFEGRALGAETFVTFDKDAVKRLKHQGYDAALLS
jgi:predicted nucleic-acid-binding protein